MKRHLNEMDIEEAVTGMLNATGGLFITMSPGQWDTLLQSVYDRGGVLIELDENEIPVKAYQRGAQ